MNREAEFHRLATQNKATLGDVQRPEFEAKVAVYASYVANLAKTFDVTPHKFQNYVPHEEPSEITKEDALGTLVLIETALNEIQARNIFEIDSLLIQEYVPLQDDWKADVQTWIAHIFERVRNAEVAEGVRERIVKKLTELQKEVERNRTRVQSWTEAFLEIAGAAGKGAKDLEPIVKLMGKIGGHLKSADDARKDAQQNPRLPSPEALGLERPENAEESATDTDDR